MELNNKEKKIKQVLSEVNYQVDTDFLWKEVSKELDGKKKKRRFFWIFPILGIGLLSVLFFNNYSIVENTGSEISEKTTKVNDSVSSQPSTNALSSNARSIENNENKSELNVTPSTTKSSQSTSSENNTTQIGSLLNSTKKSITSSSLNTTTNQTYQSKTIGNQNNTTNRTNQKFTIKSTNTKTPSITLYRSEESIYKNPLSTTKLIQANKEETELKLKLSNLAGLTPIQWFHIESVTKNELIIPAFVLVESNSIKSRFYLAAGMGTIRDITTSYAGSEGLPANLIDKENSVWGINSTLLFGIQTKEKFKIFGGFDYAQLITQYYNGETEIVDGETPTTFESIDNTDALVTSEGYLATTTSINKDILWHRHHNMLNFQLGVSKDLLLRSNFIVEPEVSMLQNIVSSHKGYYFSEQSPNFIKFERGEENPYRKNTGLKTQLGLNLGYETSKWQFAVNTAWRSPLSYLTNGTNNFQIKNSQLSIQARINCLLNWEKN